MLAAALTLLATFAAVGMWFAAGLSQAPTRPGFHRLTMLIALTFFALGWGLRVSPWGAGLAEPTGLTTIAYAVAFLAAMVFALRYGVPTEKRPFSWAGLAAVAAFGALINDPAAETLQQGIGFAGRTLYNLNLLTIAPALGCVLYAMLLAHWYLIEPKLSTAPLKRVLLVFALAMILELILLVGIFVFHWPAWSGGEGGMLRAFTLGNALFVAMRAVLGVLAPLGLVWMTWKTVEIRSIQSATGILYAAVVFVLFGETISAYLSLATGQPY